MLGLARATRRTRIERQLDDGRGKRELRVTEMGDYSEVR